MELEDGLRRGDDGVVRCGWAGDDPLYVTYHDREWGRPVHDERRLFEKLCLEGFQAGLAWITVLRKRPAFRAAFADFDPQVVASYDDADLTRLLADDGIVRHRGKIEATIANANAYLRLIADGDTLDGLVWSHAPEVHHPPRSSDEIATTTAESTALARELKRRGWRFVGPTTVHAFMQSMGIVDDHLVGCAARGPQPR